MYGKLIRLRGANVRETGMMTNRRGEPTGFRVKPGGYMIFDETDRIIGTLTMVGRVYDRDGFMVTQIERHDMAAKPSS